MSKLSYIIKKSWYFAWHRHHFLIPLPILKNYAKSFFRYLKKDGGINQDIFSSGYSYNKWRKSHKVDNIKNNYKELITVIYPITFIDYNQIEKTVESILKQNNNIQLLISINKQDSKIIEILNKYNKDKYELTFTKKDDQANIINELIKKAKGKYISFINDNMILETQTFNYIGKYINEKSDIIYSDEDIIFNDMYCSPTFKPDWAIDSFLGNNYFGSFITIKKSLINKVGYLNPKYKNHSFNELVLRCISNTKNVGHIPYVLFHSYNNIQKDLKMDEMIIKEYLKYNNLKGDVIKSDLYDGFNIKYHHSNPLVSIIIPVRNQLNYTKDCIDSITNDLSYKNYEIILIDNGSDEKEMLEYLENLPKTNKKVNVLKNPMPFNFAALCNYGVKHSHGDYYLFLNNDTKIIDSEFLDWMVGYASLKHVGAVGMKLLFDDRVVQHMGVVLYDGGYAGHFGTARMEDYPGHLNMCVRPYNFSVVTGACLLIEKNKFKEIKGFDENLVVALNDVDLCIKLLDKGYLNVCINNMKMFHFESKSRGYDDTKEKSKRLEKEYKYLKGKWAKKYGEDKYYSKFFF